jgi:predicted nucleic acid-binding protein
MAILVDTNVLLRVAEPTSVEHRECADAMNVLTGTTRSELEPVFCAQVSIEFWVVATRPVNVNGLGMGAVEAAATLDGFEGMMRCLPEPADAQMRWRDVVDRFGALGKTAHDARLIAVMLANGVDQLLTLNTADFRRYVPAIRCLSPRDLLSLP